MTQVGVHLASHWAASLRTVHVHRFLRADSPSHLANSNALQSVYLCDISVSSRGAVSLPEEVCCRGDWGEPTVSQIFPISFSAGYRLTRGKNLEACFLLGDKQPEGSQAVFHPQWPSILTISGRIVTQHQEVCPYEESRALWTQQNPVICPKWFQHSCKAQLITTLQLMSLVCTPSYTEQQESVVSQMSVN